MKMNAERLRIALSKIAPLEQWDASWSDRGPRVCWKLFRPNPQEAARLLEIISSFQGHRRWHLVDYCLEPGVGLLSPPGESAHFLAMPTVVQISDADAASDLAVLANEIEKRLDLVNVQPRSFSEALLTKEGLQKSRGPFEDFEDGGQRLVHLIVNPGAAEMFEPRETDIMLHFGPMYDEMTAISGDIVGTDLTRRDGQTLTEAEAARIERQFPVVSSISDYYEDAYLSPREAEALSKECVTLEKIISSPNAARGLDKLSRIANWAAKERYGVLFSAP